MQPVQIGMNSALVLLILLLAVPLQLFLTHYVNTTFGEQSDQLVSASSAAKLVLTGSEEGGSIQSTRKEALIRLSTGMTNFVEYVQETAKHYSKWRNIKNLFLIPYMKGSQTKQSSTKSGKSNTIPVNSVQKEKNLKSTKKSKAENDDDDYFTHSKTPRTNHPAQVKLKVGQVVKHTKAGFYAVIVGWDEVAKAPEKWLAKYYSNRPGVLNLPNYLVLVDSHYDPSGNPLHYIPQEDLELVENNIQIQAPEINKYFEGYKNHRHLPRPWLMELYPKDSQK